MIDTVDINSPTWRLVKALCEEAAATAQPLVNAYTTKDDETNYMRGRLSLAHEILKLAAPPPAAQHQTARARDKSAY